MVDDPDTDSMISWSSEEDSFVVWDKDKFCMNLLPNKFKHNSFDSFKRQLYNYGFKRVSSERLEFKNEKFIKGQNHLLKTIKRRGEEQTQLKGELIPSKKACQHAREEDLPIENNLAATERKQDAGLSSEVLERISNIETTMEKFLTTMERNRQDVEELQELRYLLPQGSMATHAQVGQAPTAIVHKGNSCVENLPEGYGNIAPESQRCMDEFAGKQQAPSIFGRERQLAALLPNANNLQEAGVSNESIRYPFPTASLEGDSSRNPDPQVDFLRPVDYEPDWFDGFLTGAADDQMSGWYEDFANYGLDGVSFEVNAAGFSFK